MSVWLVCLQFFVTLAPNIDYLDGKHTVFGEVGEGFDVLQKLNEVYVDKDSRPYQDIRSAGSDVALDVLAFITPPPIGKWSIVMSVSACVFVCPRSYLRNYTSDVCQFFVPVSYGGGSVFLWQCT